MGDIQQLDEPLTRDILSIRQILDSVPSLSNPVERSSALDQAEERFMVANATKRYFKLELHRFKDDIKQRRDLELRLRTLDQQLRALNANINALKAGTTIPDQAEALSPTDRHELFKMTYGLKKIGKHISSKAVLQTIGKEVCKEQQGQKNDTSSESKAVLEDLRPTTKQFLQTCQGYLSCRAKMDAKYKEVDELALIANFSGVKPPDGSTQSGPEHQQESVGGQTVNNLAELYDAAVQIHPIYKQFVQSLVKKVNLSCKESSDDTGDVHVILPPLKKRERALQKARDDYSNLTLGPEVSWLYDIVRGSILFHSAVEVTTCLDILLNGEGSSNEGTSGYRIIKVKNRFAAPSLTGYRDVNIQLKLDSGRGFWHVCEIQIHHKAIQALDKELGSHTYYEYFRWYFAGATESLEDRLDDLKLIMGRSKEGKEETPLDDSTLLSLLDNCKDADRVERLADLFHYQLCEYDWALYALRKVVDLVECSVITDDARVIKLWSRIGSILEAQGNAKRAMELYESAFKKSVGCFSNSHPEFAETAVNFAGALVDDGQVERAMALYKKSLEIWRRHFWEDNLNVATVYNNMGAVVMNHGDLDDAMFLYKKSLSIYEKTLGEDHPAISKIYNNIALILERKGELDESISMYHRVLELGKRNHGEYHTDMATAYANLAHALDKKGEVNQAISYFERALEITIQNLGKDHPSAVSLNESIFKLESTKSSQN